MDMDMVLGVGCAIQAVGSQATANGELIKSCGGPRPTQEHASFCLFVGALQYVAS